MGKQYTFKTTKDTEWLEDILDKLPSQDRSRYIRMALVLMYDHVRPAVTRKVSPEVLQVLQSETDDPLVVTPKVRTDVRPITELGGYNITRQNGFTVISEKPKATDWAPSATDEPEFEAQEADLDSVLDNLNF